MLMRNDLAAKLCNIFDKVASTSVPRLLEENIFRIGSVLYTNKKERD